jgi:hypothetical protein
MSNEPRYEMAEALLLAIGNGTLALLNAAARFAVRVWALLARIERNINQ